jgi:hypothetical protein
LAQLTPCSLLIKCSSQRKIQLFDYRHT